MPDANRVSDDREGNVEAALRASLDYFEGYDRTRTDGRSSPIISQLQEALAALRSRGSTDEHDENCWIACPHDTPPGSTDTRLTEALKRLARQYGVQLDPPHDPEEWHGGMAESIAMCPVCYVNAALAAARADAPQERQT